MGMRVVLMVPNLGNFVKILERSWRWWAGGRFFFFSFFFPLLSSRLILPSVGFLLFSFPFLVCQFVIVDAQGGMTGLAG